MDKEIAMWLIELIQQIQVSPLSPDALEQVKPDQTTRRPF